MDEKITKENYAKVLEDMWAKHYIEKKYAKTEYDGKTFYFVSYDQMVDNEGNPYQQAIRDNKIYQLTYTYPDNWNELDPEMQDQSWDQIDWNHALDAEQLTDDLDETIDYLNGICYLW